MSVQTLLSQMQTLLTEATSDMGQVGAKVNVAPTASGGSGLNQLTGDVTAGPGTGSQPATLVATSAVKAIIAAWSAVTSVFGRTGAVTAQKGDYNGTQIANVVVAVTQSASPAIDTDNGNIFEIFNLAQAITSLTTNLTGTPVDGQQVCIAVSDNGTARGITYGAKWVNQGGAAPTTTTVGAITYIWFIYSNVATAFIFQYANVASSGGALTTSSGVAAANTALTAGSTQYTWLTTGSLATGVWLLTVQCCCYSGGAEVDIKAVVNTATATFAGVNGATMAPSFSTESFSFQCVVTVTVAGTLNLVAMASNTGATVEYQSTGGLALNVAGYTATKIG